MRLRPVSQNLSLVCLHSALAQVDLACGQIDTQANLVVQNSSIAQPRIASIVPSLLLDMPILISSDAWAKWQPVIEELHADYEFPVKTKTELNTILSLYTGEGISFCLNQDHWRFIIDVIRSRDDVIEDIVTISVIKRPQGNTNTANGWLITRTCDIHGALDADKVVENRDLAWFGILKNSLSHKQCCRVEVTGPYVAQAPLGNWKGIRLAVNQYSYVREIASLRQQLQEKKSETSSKRKLPVVAVTEDDIAESPAFKKLRKSKDKYKDAKTEAEDRATAAEDRGKHLEQEIESLRGELLQKKMLVAQKDKAINDLRREYAIKDVSLQSLREQVAKQRKGPSTGGEDLGEHLESAMKINEDKAVGLATENSVLKGVVDRQKAEMNELTRKLTRGNRAMDTKSRDFKRLQELGLREVPQEKIPGNLRGLQANDSNNQFIAMAPQLLSDAWERWAPAVTYFMRQELLPIRDRAHFQRCIGSKLEKDNSIRLDVFGRQFIVDLIETSPDKSDIVAFSIIKFLGHRLTGGEVVTELSANHPRASDHVELIPGMETDWMKNSQKDDRHPRAIAETSRQKIVKVARERKIHALKLPPSEPKEESSMTSTEDLGTNVELSRNLSALCKKAATLLASKGEHKATTFEENISTQEATSFISKAIDDLQHWAPPGPFDQAQRDKPSKKETSSKSTVKAKQNHSQEKLQLESEVRRITEEKEQLEKLNADLREDVELSRSRAKDAEERLRQLTGQHSGDANGEGSAENSAHQFTGQLQEACQHHKDRQEIIHKHVSEEGQDSPQSPSDDVTDDEELVMNDDSFDEDALSEELAKELRFMAKGEDVARKESGKQLRVSQLERELETTKESLKNKTDELASATEKHAKELIEAGGNKEKCRCKDKEAYVESLEEHVEKLRGTMEDVLRDVSTYQGRKRRRTEGPDFKY
ncbi:hypothetical protein K4K57_003208 [Colletotrichum sp. SAR 10_99]|nr:hypothetical protein K4K57_003208 [Colletotrichum sp. SAR 10_99]